MLCPYLQQSTLGHRFPCGKCAACLCNRRRKVVGRLLLESGLHEHSTFATLTYREEDLPRTDTGAPLVKEHLPPFLRKLRYLVGPFRYFVAGEYGAKYGRPHYHALLFGLSSEYLYHENQGPLAEAWPHGFPQTYPMEQGLAMYASSYVSKKRVPLLAEQGELPPEFSRWSRMPGIGADALTRVARRWTKSGACAKMDNVPHEFRLNGKTWPLDRYARTRLGELCGVTPKPRALDEPPTYVELEDHYQTMLRYEEKEVRRTARQARAL